MENNQDLNIIEELMKYDAGDLKTPTKDFKMKLKKLDGKEFTFPLTALSTRVASQIQEDMYKFRATDGGVDMELYMRSTRLKTIEHGCPEVFTNKKLMERFGARTPHDFIDMLLVVGEQDVLKREIDRLTGYSSEKEKVDEVKN